MRREDVTADGIYTYQYDAEGRLASVDGGSTETYTYNVLGQQVRLTTPNYTWDHVYDAAGSWIGRYSNGGWPVSGVFHLGSRPFAIYLDQAYFVHVNALGSTSMTSNAAGNVDGDSLLYPWGQSWVWGTPELHYAAFEYNDSATGLDPTPNRQYPPAQGRWLTPDPGGMKVVHLDDPQTWNMYAYVGNNPTTLTDATGLEQDKQVQAESICIASSNATCAASAPGTQDQPLTSVTVLGNKVGITYGPKLSGRRPTYS